MRSYHQSIQATRIDLIHFDERPRRPDTCVRCPTRVHEPRPGGMCQPCRDAVNFEKKMESLGVDLAALADDEFVVIRERKIKGKRCDVAIIVRESDEVAA